MRTALLPVLFVIGVLTSSTPAEAQSGPYVGGSAGMEGGMRGNIDLGRLPVGGGVLGWRFSDSWSAEVHLDGAVGESSPRQFDTLLYTGLTLTSEVYGRTVRQDRAGIGYSVLAVWTSGSSGRVRASVTMGVSERRFQTREITTVSRVGPDVNLPPTHPALQDRDETSTLLARGLTGGFMVPIIVGKGWTVAPEIRFTRGLWNGYISDYLTVRARLMWGF